jgi:ATP-dependent helicase HepA
MIRSARELAERSVPLRIGAATNLMREGLTREMDRLRSLAEIDDHVHSDEIARAEEERAALEKAIAGARLRLDALRLVLEGRGPR